MKHAITLLLSFLFCFIITNETQAQSKIKISGSLKDTVTYTNLGLTSISAVRASDSILISFTRADNEGNFFMSLPENEKYILMFSHPMMAILNKKIEVKNEDINLGEVVLSSKTFILEEVLVIGTRAITIKGDTTEYAADSFKVSQYANVDELLKKLPGIEVDDKGNITAHGEKVQRMMVDGDEFFSDDPAVLSKMLRASAVNKVQVYDGKSEDAKFTGVDDGVRIKTINLELKDDAKKGSFGKIELGGGLPAYWENQAMINIFKDKRKFSAFGIMSNTNKVGLGWEESSKYGGRESRGFRDGDDGGGFSFEFSDNAGDEFSSMGGSFSGQGLPKTINGGLHFGDKYGANDQHELSADYRINDNSVSVITHQRDQYSLADTQYINVKENERYKRNLNNNLSSRAQFFIDSATDIIINLKGSNVRSNTESDVNSYYADMNDNRLNESNTQQSTKGEKWNGNLDFSFRKKFKKTGRTLISTLSGSHDNYHTENAFSSNNKFYNTGEELNYNQTKKDTALTNSFRFKITYTEPLSKKIFLVTNIYTNYDGRTSSKMTFDKTPIGDTLNQLFSSSFDYKVWTYSAGTSLRFDLEKYHLSLGGNVAYTDFMRKDLMGRLDLAPRNYFNFFPNISLRKSRRQMDNFSISYNGATNQPTIEQLQPITTNQDPLNIVLGNPNLEQEFRHSLNINYGKYELLKEQYYYVGASANLTTNAISSEQNISEQGVRTYRSINLPRSFSSYMYAGIYKKIKAIKSQAGINLNGGYNQSPSIINGENTATHNYNIGLGLSLDYDRDSTINVSFNINPDFNSNFTNTSRTKTEFFSIRNKFNFKYSFPKGLELGTDMDWYVREKTSPSDINNNIFLWNAYISQSFLKDKSLVLRLTGNDILNQNVGYSRYAFNNIISETSYNNIRRYFMLSLAWNFTHSSAISAPKKDPNEVEQADTNPDAYQQK